MADRIGNLGKQITLRELRNRARLRVLDYRSVQYVLGKRGWDKIWAYLEDYEKVMIESWVIAGSSVELKDWVHDHPHLDLGEKSLGRLRKMAADLGIKNYSRISKHRLISAIALELEVAAS